MYWIFYILTGSLEQAHQLNIVIIIINIIITSDTGKSKL